MVLPITIFWSPPQFHTPAVQHKRATPFQCQKSVNSRQKKPKFNTPVSSTRPSDQHARHFNTPVSLTHPSVLHTPQFNTPLSSTHPSVQLTCFWCWTGGFLVLNIGVCWTEGFFVLNWRILSVEKVWSVCWTEPLSLRGSVWNWTVLLLKPLMTNFRLSSRFK